MDGLAHLELALGLAGGVFLILGLGGKGRYHQFGYGRLEFHIVGARFLGGIHHAARHVEVAVVVHTGLGYDYYLIVSHWV